MVYYKEHMVYYCLCILIPLMYILIRALRIDVSGKMAQLLLYYNYSLFLLLLSPSAINSPNHTHSVYRILARVARNPRLLLAPSPSPTHLPTTVLAY
jgi:hypothetical protein